jgi:hypothetical protein
MRSRDDLRLLLASVRRRWRGQVSLRAAGRAAAIAAAPLFAAAVVARLLPLGDGALILLVLFAVLAALAGAAVIARAIPAHPSDRQIARFIEERVASDAELEPLDDVLVSAVETLDGGEPFHAVIAEAARRRILPIDPSKVVPSRAMRRAAFEAIGGVAVLAVAVALAWPAIGRAAESAWIAVFPDSIQVEVLPGDTRVVAGKPLRLRASVRAGRQLLTRFTPTLTVSAGGEERSVAMTPDGTGFQFSFDAIDRTFRYRVTAGSTHSREFTVTALFAPRVKQIDLRYEYPSFAKLPPRDEQNGGDIYAPAGTRVHVRVHTDKPIASGQLALRGTAAAGLRRAGDRTLEGDLILAKDDSYRVGLTDADGLGSTGDTEYFIRVMDDRPPDVRILRPAGDQQITPLEEVAIEARADDDYGIAAFDLVYVVAGRAPIVVPLTKAAGTDLARVGSHVLQAENLRVQPGDVITYYARAADVARGKRSTVARSDMFFLEVRPFSEEFVLAQSQGMAGMSGEQVEALIAAQKDIINATWNIERRAGSGAGRSPDDITAIASAQSELRARAEQLSPVRGRGPFRGPQAIGAAPQGQPRTMRAGDPVSLAIAAMGRAVEQLQGQRTSDALTHEMAALQGLLQAQAEIRRREVMQQNGSGMGGMGRQGQDLSALFDKELQRQQRTNYETKSQVEQTPERQDGTSAVDRIRDLARRQEELSRRQRELAAASLPQDEMKRQLEKLTREQEALREQAEEMARQMSRQSQGGQSQQGQKSGEQSQGSGGMRDVAEQMRGAASDLQRQAPREAAERGEQAAARLKSLEQQLRGDSRDSRDRAAGELRLEAQQIADEQRRIAGEAERLEKGASGSSADAWRRLAGEKDKLADRVDELQRGAERLARGPAGAQESQKDAQAGQPGAAAREIQRERIAGRMRDTAKQIREGASEQPAGGRAGKGGQAPAPKVADAEQQIARTLDRVVDQLGAGEGVQDLARQLDGSREMRERLEGLERQLREAEAKDAGGRQGRASAANGSSAGGSDPGSGGTSSKGVQQLREQYAKEAQRSLEALSRLERSQPGSSLGGTSPEQHEWSVTDQGTEAFKQDFSQWQSLKKNVESALDRHDASVIARAARKGLDERLSAGGSERVPEAYRRFIARYYESLARKK